MPEHDSRSERDFSSVIGTLYDACVDHASWDNLSQHISQAFTSTSAVLKTWDAAVDTQLVSATSNFQVSEADRSWADHWHRQDLWVKHSASFGFHKVFFSQELLPDQDFERSGFYQDWCRRLEIFHMVGVLFPAGAGQVGGLGIHRDKAGGGFIESDRRRLHALAQHLHRAIDLRARLGRIGLFHTAAVALLDRSDVGTLIVERTGKVLYANRMAEEVLATSSTLDVQHGRLHCSDPLLQHRLQRSIRDAIKTANDQPTPPDATLICLRPGRLPLTVLVAPMRPSWFHEDVREPAALVFVRDPESNASATTLQALFGLTPTEAAVATALGSGRSPEQIATTFGIGIGTVRTHLKKIMSKTGTQRLAALSTLITKSVAALM